MVKRTALEGIAQATSLPEDTSVRFTRLTTYFWVLIVIWTLIMICLFVLDFLQIARVQREMAKTEARASFNKDQAFRFWAANHGGVYVPINSRTPSNPFLSHVPERDITTESGKALTLMNPAYMLRQMLEEYEDMFGVRGHITSLKHYRPETAPDEWEKSALTAFEQGDKEALEFTEIEGTPYLRLMRPMMVKKSCLKCHAKQGYKVGDVRGGVSISVPMGLYATNQRKILTNHALALGLLWLFGIAGIVTATRGLRNRIRERDRAEAELQKTHDRLEIRVEERTVELKKEIEEHKQTEDALRKEKDFTENLINTAQTIILVLDTKGRIVRFNGYTEDLSGYKLEEVQGRDWFSTFLPKQNYDQIGELFRAAVSDIQTRGNINPIVAKDGHEIIVEWYDKTLKDADGNAIGLLAIGQDITERKQAEEALRESEERFRTVADFTHDWEFWAAPDGHHIYVSPSCERITGYGPEAFINDPGLLKKIIHPDDHSTIVNHLGEAEDQEKLPSIDFRIITRSGEVRWMSHVCQTVYGADGTYLGRRGSNRDVSKHKQMEAQLQQASKMEAISTLAGGVAHEFNNALSSITGHTGLLEMEYSEDAKIMDYAKAMKQSAHRMARLTSQLLAYARGGKYNSQTISPSNFVEGALPIIRHILDPDIRVETYLPLDIMNVKVDRTQMQMVLSAIVANSNEAIDHPGCIRISTRNVDLDKEFMKDHPDLKPGQYVCLSIKDDGKGMDDETKDRIFEPFFTTHFIGRGLGMPAAYGIVKNHDGAITVDSEPGKGTVVRIYLPAIEAKEEVKKKVVPGPKVEIAMGEGTILIIEDEEPLVDLFRKTLERFGYRVLVAETGKQAVDLAKSFDGRIDLALLDIKLPDMDGGRVYPLIMEARPDLKVIVCSGYSIHGPAQDILDAGAEGFIQKPFSIAPFAEKLKEVLEGK